MLASANIPSRAGTLTRDILATKELVDFGDYFASENFKVGLTEGVGFNVYGHPKLRSDALMLAAKSFALGKGSTYFASLHQLIGIINAKGERLDMLRRIQYLFIDWFEREFAKTDERPYSFHELVAVEEFLTQRRYSKQITFFSSVCTWDNHKWWSKDFLGGMSDIVINIKAG